MAFISMFLVYSIKIINVMLHSHYKYVIKFCENVHEMMGKTCFGQLRHKVLNGLDVDIFERPVRRVIFLQWMLPNHTN